MDRGAWRATGRGVTESQTRLSPTVCQVDIVVWIGEPLSLCQEFWALLKVEPARGCWQSW